MSDLAVRAIENARRERLRIAASTPSLVDDWVSMSARFAVSERADPPDPPPEEAEIRLQTPAVELDDDTKDVLPLPPPLPL